MFIYLFAQDKSEEILKNFYFKFKEAGIQFILTNSDVLEPKGGQYIIIFYCNFKYCLCFKVSQKNSILY